VVKVKEKRQARGVRDLDFDHFLLLLLLLSSMLALVLLHLLAMLI